MRDYEEDQIEFSVLSVVRDPLSVCVEELALNVKRLQAIRERLVTYSANGSSTSQSSDCVDDIVLGPSPAFRLTQNDIDLINDSDEQIDEYQNYDFDELARKHESLHVAQGEIRASIREEIQSCQADDDYAEGRRHDYTPAVSSWARILARKGIVRGLIGGSG
jgi:ubiquitin carboxyl-terminal hydrolase L5